MHPYRSIPAAAAPPTAESHEDLGLGLVLMVLGVVRVVPAITTGEAFGAEATIAAVMLALGTVILAGIGRRRLRARRSRLGARRQRSSSTPP